MEYNGKGETANRSWRMACSVSKEMREIFENAQPRKVEKRRGLDRRGKIGIALSAAGWALWSAGLYAAYFAFPQSVTYFDTLYGKTPNVSWTPSYFFVSEGLWAAGAALCLLSLAQFRKRYKRRTDKKHMGILTALVFNVLTMLAFGIFILVMGF